MAHVEPSAPKTRAAHQHGSRCYWDFRDCGWHCQPVTVAVPDTPEALAPAVKPPDPVETALVTR